MPSRIKSSAIRTNAISAKAKHRLQELPEQPRGLACLACRKKKHLCDRIKPSCTTCTTTKIECAYRDRKARATVVELEDVLQKLERKYNSRLKAIKGHREKTPKPNPGAPTTTDDEQRTFADQASVEVSHSDSFLRFYTLKLGTGQAEVPYNGYQFDETFLTLSSPSSRTSFRVRDASPLTSSLKSSVPHPTRIFSCVPKYPPILPLSQWNPPDTSLELELHPLEADMFEVYSIASTLSPVDHPTPPPHDILNQFQVSMYDQWSSPAPVYHTIPDEISRDSNSHPTTILERARTPPGTTTGIIHAPTLHFSRATWWDHLTNTYTLRPVSASVSVLISRQDAALEISRDVCGFFKSAPIWLTFINVPLFFDMFHHTELRSAIQPSLILGILAYSKFLQSDRDTKRKNPEERERSWRQSVTLRNLAQASFDASYNAGWIDLQLAQAAWILVLYEICSHPDCSMYRMQSAITLLDNVIRALGLTSLDATDPRVPTFASNEVPALGRPTPNGAREQALQLDYSSSMDFLSTSPPTTLRVAPVKHQVGVLPTFFNCRRSSVDQTHIRSDHDSGKASTCPCEALSLAGSPDMLRSTPTWTPMPRWALNATTSEVQREEGRRLVWSALVMLGPDAAARQASGMPQLDLHISKPENLALLFPGEDNYTSLPDVDTKYSGKESHWALWGRTMLLWLACVQHASRAQPHTPLAGFSVPPSIPDENTIGCNDTDFAMRAWMETLAIEDALNSHSCATEQSFVYQAREFLSIIQMQVSGGFRNSMPVAQTGVNFSQLDHDSVLRWLRQRQSMGMTLEAAIYGDAESPSRKMLVERPFVVYMCIASEWRALELWKLDHSLLLAVGVALSFQRVIDWYQEVWPCTEVQKWATKTAGELRSICKIIGRDME
ncbi:hypothetical protein FRB95_014805 [Tulasnella sp. JGI-2019a]|nr:hypothetical protein FRB95_014805 [Tulasnella sp. JGI-2019a]